MISNLSGARIRPSLILIGAQVFPLEPGTKRPATLHGFRDAIPAEHFEASGNYGIWLRDKVCVDFDDLDFGADTDIAAFFAACEASGAWSQVTGGEHHGRHFLFDSTGTTLPTRARIDGASGKRYGEIMSGGCYIVGPGSYVKSAYELVSDKWLPAPPFVIERAQRSPVVRTVGELGRGQTHGPVAAGGGAHRAELLATTKFLAERGFKPEGIVKIVDGMIASGELLADYDDANPFGIQEVERMAATIEPRPIAAPERDDAIIDVYSALDIDWKAVPRKEMFIRGLCWRGVFQLLYGAGGIGKTGVAAYMLALISQKGYNVAFLIAEQGAEEFTLRYLASGGVLARLLIFNQTPVLLPRDLERIAELIRKHELVAVLFDSLLDHPDRQLTRGLDAANAARTWAGPLNEMALETNCLVLGLAHENKSGALEGAEMQKNKARIAAHMYEAPDGSIEIEVEKTNKKNQGKFIVTFEEFFAFEPGTNRAIYEIDEDGNQEQEKVWACVSIKPAHPVINAQVPEYVTRARRITAWLKTQDGSRTTEKIIVGAEVNKSYFKAAITEAMRSCGVLLVKQGKQYTYVCKASKNKNDSTETPVESSGVSVE